MKVSIGANAVVDLEDILDWIAEDDAIAAEAVIGRIFGSIELLGSFPHMGRAGREEGTREWVVPGLRYIVVDEIHEVQDEVTVVAVFHGARDM